jgi:MoaA/NifB/PqqE/SkfB family radical SAM enzyme
LPRISLVTNGSLLSGHWIEGRDRLPFHDITVSLNAATAETYEAIHGAGVSWDRVRRNLDALAGWRGKGLHRGSLTYSMVILRRNVGEIEAFAAMAARDGAGIRFLLPVGNRNKQSIMTDPACMRMALEGLDAVLAELGRGWRLHEARQTLALRATLRDRLERGILKPL